MKNGRVFVCVLLVVILSLSLMGCNVSIGVKNEGAICPVCGRMMEYKCAYCEASDAIAEYQTENGDSSVEQQVETSEYPVKYEECEHPDSELEVLINEWRSYPNHVFEEDVCYTYGIYRIYECQMCGEDIWVLREQFEVPHDFDENGECIECGYKKK